MFPSSFNARVAERMAIWGGILGFLIALYAGAEAIHANRMDEISEARQRATSLIATHIGAEKEFAALVATRGMAARPEAVGRKLKSLVQATETMAERAQSKEVGALARELHLLLERIERLPADTRPQSVDQAIVAVWEKRAELGKAIAAVMLAVNQRQTGILASHEQNEMLLSLLFLFVVIQILILEYRWLVRPIVCMASVLKSGEESWRDLARYVVRRDEIGTFAQALTKHFSLVRQQQDTTDQAQAALSERLSRQESFHTESVSFQARMAEIVQRLEEQSGRMSAASENLVSISSEADLRAGASAQSTERVSAHVDLVACSIRDIGSTLTAVVAEAEKTSAVAAAARSLVAAAQNDVNALTQAARTIEPVIGLIEDVASQTNLLALNATIEAARAGEMGRGFGVVAHEVKQLASRTARATDEVRSGLQGIAAASERIAERVASLVNSMQQVDGAASTIAASMRQQDSTSQAITSNTARAAADVREVATTVKEVADIIAAARTAADQVTKGSTDLGQQAADLRTAVVRFIETTERIAA
jgi:methyl-accepting chemotaxis protein